MMIYLLVVGTTMKTLFFFLLRNSRNKLLNCHLLGKSVYWSYKKCRVFLKV